MSRLLPQTKERLKTAGKLGELDQRRRRIRTKVGRCDVEPLAEAVLKGLGYEYEKSVCKTGLVKEAVAQVEMVDAIGAVGLPAMGLPSSLGGSGGTHKSGAVKLALNGEPPPMPNLELEDSFWTKKASPNEVVSWVIRNYYNPTIKGEEVPDPAALTLLASSRASFDIWQTVFQAYSKLLNAKAVEEERDPNDFDGRKQYDLLAKMRSLEEME